MTWPRSKSLTKHDMGSYWWKGIEWTFVSREQTTLQCMAAHCVVPFTSRTRHLRRSLVCIRTFQNKLNFAQPGDTAGNCLCRQLFVTLPPEEHRDVELLEAAHDSEMDVAGAVSVPGRAEPRGVRCQASAGAVSDQTLHVLLGGQVCSD